MEGSLTTGGKNWTACLELFCSGKRNRLTGTYKFRQYSLHGPQEEESHVTFLNDVACPPLFQIDQSVAEKR